MITARTNPFRTERLEALLPWEPAWVGATWDALLARLAALSFRAAVVGPHGSGKTTFLEALAAQLTARGIPVASHFLNRDSGSADLARLRSLAPRHSDGILLLDGAEQLSRGEWRRLQRLRTPAGGLVVTTHRPNLLPTLLETRATPGILRRCVQRLDPHFPLDSQKAEALLHRHAGNLRHALLECYDRAAAAAEVQVPIRRRDA